MVLSNADALLVAVPMIGTLVVGYFRLDELVGTPRKRLRQGHKLAALDNKGRMTCLDPDGTVEGAPVRSRVAPTPRRPMPRAELD